MEQIEMTDTIGAPAELTAEELARGRAITQAPAPTLFDKGILLSVELRRPGIRKKVSGNKQQDAADAMRAAADQISVSKEILASPSYDDLVSLDGEIRAYVTSYCMPGPFRAGVYFLANSAVQKVDRKLQAFKTARDRLADKCAAEYPGRIEAAKRPASEGGLGELFEPTDYPSVEKFRAGFSMETKILGINTPAKLKEISTEIWEREEARSRAEIASYTEDMKALLRAQMSELTTKALERLTPNEDGKPKTFRNSLIGNVKDFLATFDDKNSVFGDEALQAQAVKLRKLVDGLDPDVLRNDDQIRERVRKDFASVQTELDSMIVTQTRKIDFDA